MHYSKKKKVCAPFFTPTLKLRFSPILRQKLECDADGNINSKLLKVWQPIDSLDWVVTIWYTKLVIPTTTRCHINAVTGVFPENDRNWCQYYCFESMVNNDQKVVMALMLLYLSLQMAAVK